MPTVRYTVAQGEVIAEKRGGVRSLYTPDPLGSTIALIDNTQTITDTWVYWPYGEVKTRTGTTATPFQYVGTQGYYHDNDSRAYVRARYLDKAKARWLTEDPIRFGGGQYMLYCYADNSPMSLADSSGKDPCRPRLIQYPKDCSWVQRIWCRKSTYIGPNTGCRQIPGGCCEYTFTVYKLSARMGIYARECRGSCTKVDTSGPDPAKKCVNFRCVPNRPPKWPDPYEAARGTRWECWGLGPGS